MFSASLAAFARYPQEVQYSIRTIGFCPADDLPATSLAMPLLRSLSGKEVTAPPRVHATGAAYRLAGAKRITF